MKNKQQTLAVSATPWWQKHTLLLLCALAFLVFANTIGHGYNMDDELVTRKQKLTSKGIRAIPEIFTSPYYSDDMGYAYEYRPVVLTSFAIEHQFFGDKPGVSHFFNVLLYVLTVVVLFKLLRKLLHAYSYWLTVLVVLLFAVHPLHSEVVASIKNRDEILALLGALGAWWFALKFIQDKKNAVLPLVLVFFTLAILSKMSILPLIFFIPLSAVFFIPTASSLRIFLVSLALLIPTLLFLPLGHANNYILLGLGTLLLPVALFKLTRMGWGEIKSVVREALYTRKHEAEPEETRLGEGWLTIDLKALVSTYTLAWAFIYAGLTYISWREESLYWSVVLIAAFLLSLHFSKKEGGILIFLFSLMISFLWVKLGVQVFFEFIIFFLLFYAVTPKSKYKGLPLLLAFVVFEVANGYLKPLSFLDPVYYLLFLLLIRFSRQKKWIAYPMYAFYLGFTVAFFYSVFKLWKGEFVLFDFVVGAVNFSLVTVALFAPLRKYFFYAFAGIFLLVNLAVAVHLLSWEKATAHPTLSAPTTTIVAKKEVNQPAVGILYPKLSKNARPILFAEMPVTTDSSLEERLGFALDVMGFYLKKMVIPYPLGYYYGYAFFKPTSLFEAVPLISLLIHLLLLIGAFGLVKKHPLLSFGIFLYLGSLVLFSGLLYPVAGVAGDRFAYLATLGWAIIVAYVFVRFVLARKTWPMVATDSKPISLLPITVLCLFYMVLTFVRNGDWKSPLVLMEHDIDYLDESAQAHNLYALNLMRESVENRKLKQEERIELQRLAVIHFDKALQIWPRFFNAAFDKGRASLLVGDYNSAIDGFEKSIAIGPEKGFVQPYIQLAKLYLQTGRSVDYLKNAKAFLTESSDPEAYNMTARGFYITGRSDSAKIYLHKAISLYPQEVSLRKNLAEIFKSESQQDSVEYYLR